MIQHISLCFSSHSLYKRMLNVEYKMITWLVWIDWCIRDCLLKLWQFYKRQTETHVVKLKLFGSSHISLSQDITHSVDKKPDIKKASVRVNMYFTTISITLSPFFVYIFLFQMFPLQHLQGNSTLQKKTLFLVRLFLFL